MEQVNEVLTIDLAATREAIRIKFKSTVDFSLATGFRQSTVFSVLGGRMYSAKPGSVVQQILRAMREHGVLVPAAENNFKEAA